MIAALDSRHNRHHRRQRGTNDSGFTLIELLVVIIILGILAAVVVFAVNGVGDKGRSSARAIDARTIATAQELFNAKNGRYGTEEELVAQQFLSQPSTYHETFPVPEGTPDSAGNGGNSSDTSQGGFVVTCTATTAGCGEGGALKMGWQQQTNPSGTGLLEDVMFINHQEGWAVGNSGRILHTIDGGVTWLQQASGFTGVGFREVDFVDADYGWAVGQGIEGATGFQDVILSTIDGGDTWVRQTNPVAGTLQLDGMDFSDRNNGWVGGRQGLILSTTNGGGTWTVQQAMNAATQPVKTIAFLDATHGWAGASTGWIYRYDAATATWSTVVTPPVSQPTISGVKFIDALRGWAVGVGGNAFRTTDGGLSWAHTHNFSSSAGGSSQASSRLAVDFVNERQGWTVGAKFQNLRGAVLSTLDGGVTWQDTSLAGMQSLQGVDFLDAAHGWAVGSGGTIYRYGPLP